MSDSTSRSVAEEDRDEDLDLSAAEEMNVRSFAKSRDDVHQRALAIIARTQHLNYRNSRNPATRYMASSSIVSSSSDELTIDLNEPNHQYNFNPTEITGRSTATTDTSISVEQMLSESNISDVRDLADELKMFKLRESCGGEQVAYTADVSLTSLKSFRSSMSVPGDWDLNDQIGDVSGEFMPSDKVKDFLKNEEELWAQEYANLPPEAESNSKKYGFESSDVSRIRFGNESASESNASVGHFFTKRSANLVEMLPNPSPPKTGKPLALVESLNTSRENVTNGDGTKVTTSSVFPQNATYGQEGESFISHKAIESYFQKCQHYSPQTVSSNLMKLKKPKVPDTQSIPASAVKPMAEVLFVTEPLPFKPLNTNSNVNILSVEKVYGDVATLKQQSTNSQIPIRSTFLTPGGHIRKNNCNKENERDLCHDENALDLNISSDTLSMSGILSSSKVQPNTKKTSHTDALINALANKSKAEVDPAENSLETKKQDESQTTPTNSPVRNRKRTRSSELNTPTRQNTVDVLYNRNNRFTPSPNQHTVNSTNSTPETPTKKNLEVLYNHNHRLTPSPNRNKDSIISISTPVTPVASFQNSNHGSRSNAYMDHFNTHFRALDNNLRSPRLLTQSNSQFSSVSDLREFSVKSSQSVLSWPSQKLRTASQKQFTIKNIGGKKLTMRIEVIGPGFQLSPPEPFQLIALQAQECRTISVVFCPIALGVAVGKLNFSHAKDTADRNIRKMIPLFGYGGHTVVEVQGVSQGIVGNPFLQLGTIGDLLNLQISGTFTVYNKGPLRGVAIIRVKSDSKKHSGSTSYSPLTITPSKCVIGPDSHTRIDVVYRPRKNDVRKLLRQEGNVLPVVTLEIFMADEPSRQRILGLINKYAKNSSDIYLLEDLFRGIEPDVVESFSDFQETEEMIGELFNKMKSTEIVLTVKRSVMDQTIESEHDFFMSDTNESMLFHTMVSDDVAAAQIPPAFSSTSNAANIASSSSTMHVPQHRHERLQADWFLNKAEIRLNPYNVDLATTEIEIHSRSRQIFEIYSNHPEMFIIKPECGVISPDSTATFSVTIKNTTLPNEAMYIRVRMDKKQDAVIPVIIQKNQ